MQAAPSKAALNSTESTYTHEQYYTWSATQRQPVQWLEVEKRGEFRVASNANGSPLLWLHLLTLEACPRIFDFWIGSELCSADSTLSQMRREVLPQTSGL